MAMDIGKVKFIPPRSDKLKRWIKGYYIHFSDDPTFKCNLTFYQNVTTTISIYKDSLTTSNGRLRKQLHRPGIGYSAILVGLVDKFQQVEFYGPLDRVAIVFHSGGLNHFVTSPLGEMLRKHYSHFTHFDRHFDLFLPELFNAPSLEQKRDLLDAFFIDRFIDFHEPTLLSAIDFICNGNRLMKVEELANLLHTSRRTLLRKFKKHLGYSIESYIAVIKFRKALLHFQQSKECKRLVEIALNSQYYDQADFNHQIKNRSELTPTELFSQLDIVDDTLFWKL